MDSMDSADFEDLYRDEDDSLIISSPKRATTSPDVIYDRENIKILKHNNDICVTNKQSKRSESVKNISLDEVIAERKILAPVKKDREKNKSDVSLMEDHELGLDDIIRKKQVGPTTTKDRKNIDRSLDDIIKESKPQPQKKLKDVKESDGEMDCDATNNVQSSSIISRKRKRQDISNDQDDSDNEERYILSPLDVITNLTEDGLLIETEIGKQADQNGRSHIWRAEYKCGTVFVKCDCARKNLAKMGAAMEFVKALKELNVLEPEHSLPECKIPEACFYDPVVVTKLEEVMQSMGLGDYRFETIQTRSIKYNRDFFTTTYYIGEDKFIGTAYDVDYSKILAAVSAYETYSEKKFHRDNYLVGEKCAKDGVYITRETEATHILTVSDPLEALNGPMAELPAVEEEELLVDDEGGLYVRSSANSHKIRRLTKLSAIENIAGELDLDLIDQ